MTTNPILVVILSFFVLKDKITSYKIIGISLGAIGATLLTLSSAISNGHGSAIGDLFLLTDNVAVVEDHLCTGCGNV